MTLIITAQTPEVIVQASDRVLSQRLPDGTYQSVDDRANKAIVLAGRGILAYSGIAELGSTGRLEETVRTDEWIADALMELPESPEPQDAIDHLQRGLQGVLSGLPAAYDKRVCVVFSTWAKDYIGSERPRPYSCLITNYRTNSGEWLRSARARFKVFPLLGSHNRVHVVTAGYPVTEYFRINVSREVPGLLRSHANLEQIADALVARIRGVAADTPKTVGDSVTVLSFPRGAIGQWQLVLSITDPLPLDRIGCLYRPGPTSAANIWYAPLLATPGHMLSGANAMTTDACADLTEEVDWRERRRRNPPT